MEQPMTLNKEQLKELGKFLKTIRERSGISQIVAADELGNCGKQYISNIENGRCVPSEIYLQYCVENYPVKASKIASTVGKLFSEAMNEKLRGNK